MTNELAALSAVEHARLEQLETVVEQGLTGFIETAIALREIRASKLYRKSHATFRAYCEQRWGFSDSRGRQLIAAAKTVTDVTLLGLPAPATEGEARRLARELRQEGQLVQHPLVAGLLFDIEGDRWDWFVTSIANHGLLCPITMYEGQILDGWQRYRACLQVQKRPHFVEYEGDEPLELWASVNFMRKSYTDAEIRKVMSHAG